MSTAALHPSFAVQTTQLTARELRALLRQPIYVVFTLFQPMIWLLIFGQLFRNVVALPGFEGQSYIGFLTPGVVAMTALFTSAWTGVGFIEEMDRGVLDRFLVSPTSRGALMSGRLANQAVIAVVQASIVLGAGIAAGARYDGGIVGVLVTVATAVLLTITFGALSCALALLTHQQDTLIAVSQFLVLPLQFMSTALIAREVAPGWIQTTSRYNPVDWAVPSRREALSAAPQWSVAWPRLGALVALALVLAWLATRAFRTHQRSL